MAAGVVAASVIAACGQVASSPRAAPASRSGSASPSTAARSPTLERVLDGLSLPAGSRRLTAEPAGVRLFGSTRDDALTKQTRTSWWTSPKSAADTLAWLESHLPHGWTGGQEGTSGGNPVAEFSAPANPYEDGPNLDVTVGAYAGGSVVMVSAWLDPLAPKTQGQHLPAVTAVTVRLIAANAPDVLGSRTFTGSAAQHLADLVNALPVLTGSSVSCLAAMPRIQLSFVTATGRTTVSVDENCSQVTIEGGSGGPGLGVSAGLDDALAPINALSTTSFLDVNLTDAAHSFVPRFAGTVTVRQGNKVVARAHAHAGTALRLKLSSTGTYRISATSPHRVCTPWTGTLERDNEIGIQLICRSG